VQLGARIRPPKPPTQMTLAEIHVWIRATPGQPHAIGRYQFIPPTLRRLQKQAGVPMEARFSPQVQDALAEILLEEAGLSRMRAGQLTRHAFMNNLAKIWAGLPNSSGRSHYHGYAGNKAVITWAQFDAAMVRIFPG
jgi:muramidase (phage lysozyme)